MQDALAALNAGGTITFPKGTYEEDLVLDKDMTVVNAGGARFAGKVTIQDAKVDMTRPTFWDNATFSVEGTKPFTMSEGYVSKAATVNLNTSGDISVLNTNFWNEGNETNSAVTLGQNTKKAMLARNVFHNSQSNGVVRIQGGEDVKLHTNSFVSMKAADNPFVISAPVPALEVRANSVVYTGDATDSTALCRFQKTKETGEKEFANTTVTFNSDNKANDVKYSNESAGLQTAFVVFSNKNNKITSDNPTVNWVQ